LVNINFRDPRAIYEQVKDGFRRLIVTGVLNPGDRMPSVRELASQLAINPNTIQRAYRELEAEGYIYSIPGKGSFAGEHREVDETRKAELLKKLDDIVTELRFLGVGAPQLIERMKNEEHKEGKKP
jgi:GntR family transcriptional regulator